jgi:hypothetical protein
LATDTAHNERRSAIHSAFFQYRAHQSNKPHDWVVIYYDSGRGERQCAVMTAERGLKEGRRIVRGLKGEFSASYFK